MNIKYLFKTIVRRLFDKPLFTMAIILFVVLYFIPHKDNGSDSNPPTSVIGTVSNIVYQLNGVNKTTVNLYDGFKLLIISSDFLTPGDTVEIKGKISIPSTGTNPGDFDYKDYLSNKGIAYISYDPEISVLHKSDNLISIIINFINRCTIALKDNIFESFGSNKPIAAALFAGDKSLLDNEVKSNYRLAGCSHILAVSGTHFAGFLYIIKYYLRKYNSKRRILISIYSILSLLICIFTGWSESVTRASILSLCSILSRDRLSGLGLGATVMLIANPYIAHSSGFQMSFLVCLSIIYIAPLLKDKLGESISIIVACQIGTIPFWLSSDLHISLWNIVVSMLMSLLAQFACMIFIPLCFLSIINSICIFPCSLVLRTMNFIIEHVAKVSVFNYQSHNISLLTYILFISILITLIARPSILKKISKLVCAVITSIYISNFIYSFYNPLLAQVVFIDVGQGDACLILSSDKSILVDAGTYEHGKTVEQVLDYYGINQLDICIASHWDEDHAGGIVYLNEQGRCPNIYSSISSDINNIQSNIIEYIDTINIGNINLKSINKTLNNDDNESSVVLLINIANTSILLTGDIPSNIEQDIAEEVGDIDILKAAHHGSRYSSSNEFLEATNPEYTIISVGKYNNYGHPHIEALERISNVSNVMRTDVDGAIMIDIYKDSYIIESYLNAH